MPGIKIHRSTVFTVGSSKLIECFDTIRPRAVAGSGCSGAALRLLCALVFANKEDMCL